MPASSTYCCVAEGVGVGPGWIYPGSGGRSLHALSDPLVEYVQHGTVAVFGVKRGQVG